MSEQKLKEELYKYKNVCLDSASVQTGFSDHELSILASGPLDWELQAVWSHGNGLVLRKDALPRILSIYMFLQKETNEVELFIVQRAGSKRAFRPLLFIQ